MNSIKNFFIQYFNRLNTGERRQALEPAGAPDQTETRVYPAINVLLFIATFVTTSIVGATTDISFLDLLISGLPYSTSLMAILLAHEFGHYFAARRFGVRSTLPYFIPFPSLIGTMGAVIKIKSPIPHRRALYYIGIMGPLSGFILSLAAVIIGVYLSEVKPLPSGGAINGFILGDSLIVSLIIKVIHGHIPQGWDVFLSPYAKAGWFGLLITNLNLMPIGQLDGSHIVYSLVGKRQRLFGWAALAGLVALSFVWPGWAVWVILTLVVLMVAHPDVHEGEVLSGAEIIIGWLCMLIFIITFVPVPVEFL